MPVSVKVEKDAIFRRRQVEAATGCVDQNRRRAGRGFRDGARRDLLT
jgi:hypothetical protein